MLLKNESLAPAAATTEAAPVVDHHHRASDDQFQLLSGLSSLSSLSSASSATSSSSSSSSSASSSSAASSASSASSATAAAATTAAPSSSSSSSASTSPLPPTVMVGADNDDNGLGADKSVAKTIKRTEQELRRPHSAQENTHSAEVAAKLEEAAAEPQVDMDLDTGSVGRVAEMGADCGATGDYITIIHFNDCYNVEPGPKSSGAAGFLTAVNQFRHLQPLILFSGDILSPSFMSTFTKGEQMIPVLNDIGVDCAVFGNHEFDYGIDNLIDFTRRTKFPWLLSNVVDKETSNQLGDGLTHHIIERQGIKIGLIGLIEEEWLSTLSTLELNDVIYTDFVVRGRELARWLKGPEHRVDFVIALTHFRTPNDVRLADSVPEIDLILGGHDHDYEIVKRPNCHIIKSGTDFREFSLIKLKLNAQYLNERRTKLAASEPHCVESGGELAEEKRQLNPCPSLSSESETPNPLKPFVAMDIERIECVAYPPEPNLKSKLDKFVSTIDEKMDKVLGQFNCELDGRFSSIRKFETNLGNFVTDIMLASTHADMAILNSGTLRSDRIHPRGDFRMRDLFNILGYIDPIAVLQASGYHIWKALENGVSQWPKLEGRFPQISGCSFTFDPRKPPLARINPSDVQIGEEPLVLDKYYKLTTKAYLASGRDGYDVLKDCEVLVPGDESPDLTTSILNHFEAIRIIKSNRRTHHRQSIICLSRSSIKKILEEEGGSAGPTNDNSNGRLEAAAANDDNNNNEQLDEQRELAEQQQHRDRLQADMAVNGSPGPGQPKRTKRLMSLYEMENEQCKLEPKVEGRIKILGVNC